MTDTGNRQYFRVSPSSENPIGVKFYSEPLKQLSSQIKVTTISVGGMGLELPYPAPELKIGLLFERIELSIPDESTCILSGIVKFMNENICGIKFININDFVLRKVSRYVFKREREILHIKKYEEAEKNIPPQKNKKLLIIDDSEAILDAYKTFFSGHGFEAISAKDGVEGIKMALTMLPDLILMDVNMPVMSGLECTRIIKSYPATSHIPIVMLTTESEKDAVIKAIYAGAKDYIIKTSDKEFILKRVESILEE